MPVQDMTTLAAAVRANRTADVAAAVARMDAIHAERLAWLRGQPRRGRGQTDALPDGVGCFNALYKRVTETVAQHAAQPLAGVRRFERPAFVQALIPVFADFYFEAYESWKRTEWVPRAWRPLFKNAHEADILPIGFAFAGMNAHINHDLAYALVEVWDTRKRAAPARGTPEHRDFQTVNEILVRAKNQIKPLLATSDVASADAFFGDLDDAWVIGIVRRDRDDAWKEATKMHQDQRRDYDGFGHEWRDRGVGALSLACLIPRFPRAR